MKISFVTALTSFEQEDMVVDSLISRSFILMKRAMTKAELLDALTSISPDDRVIIIFDESFGLTPGEVSHLRSEQIALLRIESNARLSHDEISEFVLESLRQPEQTPNLQLGFRGNRNWLAFTGASGSPGISTVALNVASELSLIRKVVLVDADPYRSDLHALLGMKSSEPHTQLHENLLLRNLWTTPEFESFLKETIHADQPLFCFDLGDAPPLEDLFTDRRAPGKHYLEVLRHCQQIIYVVQPESYGLHEMERFSRVITETFPGVSITFVLNKVGTSNRQLGMQKSFRSKAVAGETFLIPREYPILDRAQGRYATVLELSPRSTLRKGLRQLSIYLNKSS